MATYAKNQTRTNCFARVTRSLMRWALTHRHRAVIKLMIKMGADLNTPSTEGNSYLIQAALSRQAETVKALLRGGADINAKGKNGRSALVFVSREGCTDIVKILLDNGAQIETRDNLGRTPLWFAAANGQRDVVCALVSAGADVNTQRNDGVSALGFASLEGHVDVVNILLDNGAQVETRDNLGHTPMWFAAANGQTYVLRVLVSAGADVNTQRNDGVPALGFASQEGHIDVVNILLDNDAQVESRDNLGHTPMWFAAANGKTDVVRALLSAGADVSTQRNDGVSALGFASQEGYIDVVNILLDSGAQVESTDNDGDTPLWFAAANGQTDVVRALVSAGADVNTQRNDGVPALVFSSQEGNIDVVNLLLDNGAQIEMRDNDGNTSLWLAAGSGHVEVIDLLIDRGADVDAFNYARYSSVCIAAKRGHKDAVITLVGHGAKYKHLEGECMDPLCMALRCTHDVTEVLPLLINNVSCLNPARNSLNISALMMAVHSGRLDLVYTLLKHGADVYDKNFDNMLPIDIASYYGHIDIAQFLTICDSPAMALRCSNLRPPAAVHVDCRRNTALHLTTDLQAMISLLENGADVEAENIDGLRPIHCAVRTGRVELVELLINHGANVDCADVFGNRPLHEAVCHRLRVVDSLVQRAANLNIQNINGKTPLHVAVESQQSDVIVFLLNQDADVGLTDVWRNTPLHYFTSELFALSGVAESVVKLLRKKSQHLFIRNVVGVSVLTHITTHGIFEHRCHEVQNSTYDGIVELDAATLSKKHKTLARNANFSCREQLDADYLGNTPLHHAVGVYGQLKMYKISTDVTKIVEFLVKRGADINAQNKDGLTPLHVARGEQAIKTCLQHGGDQSFTNTDKRGRNFWHLSFLTRTQNETELGNTVQPMIAISDAKYIVDDLNRTPLHYACMDRNPWIAEWNWLVKKFIEQFSGQHINKQDRFGRTALHYAAISGNSELKDLLKMMKADDTIQDNYHKTSNEYAIIRDEFNTQMSQLRLTKSSSFIAKHRRDISACVQNCFSVNFYAVKECKTKLHKILPDLCGFCDKAAYVLSAWHGCRYGYTDVTRGEPVAPHQDDYQQLCKQQDFVTNNDERASEPTTLFAAIQTHVNNAMEELAKAITEHDRLRFACKVIPVGSAHEGTKIGCCDEFDYNFVLTNLSSTCKVCYSPESPPGFVLLKASSSVYDEDLKDLFDQNGILNTRIVKFKFEAIAKQVLSSASFCGRTGFEFTDPISIATSPGNAAVKLNMQIKLTLTKPVNECHVPHTISVDIVPALHINDWWSGNTRKKELCRADDCLIVLMQPHIKYPWIGWTEPYGLISFARAESRLLRECHPVAKAAYGSKTTVQILLPV